MQPILMEIIDFNQSAFLPMRYILDNILLTHKVMDWAAQSGQPLIFLKLDFAKTYDTVDWRFMFRALEVLGFPDYFIDLIRLLFLDAAATVKVNGCLSESFPIERGVRQGCPLAPYLFLLVAEVLNSMVKAGASVGDIKGILLPVGGRQQIILQYADDTSFTLLGEEQPVRKLLLCLSQFCNGSGLVLNWDKSRAYWKQGGGLVNLGLNGPISWELLG